MNQIASQHTEEWDLVIEPRSSIMHLNLREVWRYKYLLWMFVKRDLVSVYKQTILGPIWFFIQPILTTITFVIIFGGIAKISTDGLPKILFYLARALLSGIIFLKRLARYQQYFYCQCQHIW